MRTRWLLPKSSIQNKFLASALLLVIVPLGIFGVISLQISKNSIATQVSQSNLKTLGQIADKTDMLLDDVIAMSNMFFLSSEVHQAFTNEYAPSGYEYAMQRAAFERMLSNSIYSFHRLRYQVFLAGLNGFRFPANQTAAAAPSIADYADRDWFRAAVEGKGSIVWVTGPMPELEAGGGEGSAFRAVRISKRFESGAPTGIVSIQVDESAMNDLYAGALDEAQEIVIVDASGLIISSGRKEQLGSSLLDRPYYEKIRKYDSGFFMAEEEGGKQLVSFQTIGKTDWKLVSYTSTSTVLAGINRLQTIVAIVFVCVVLLAYGASYAMARRLAVPIKRLYDDFGRVEIGDLTVRSPVEGNDEIGHLTRKFNRMVERIEALLADIRREQERKRHAELQALQSQINPHFLYNTLASIRFMLLKHRPETIDSVIVALVKLLKQSISKHDELIPIEEELGMARNYIYIQQARQGDRLSVRYELEESIYAYKTIKLILQPLIENAVFHGLERKTSGQRELVVAGRLDGTDVVFEIVDNGVGFSAGQAGHATIAERDEPLVHGGGLRNVQERVQLHFGPKYGVRIDSRPDEGAKVSVRIPAIHTWEEARTG